jgi:8-oxo-dGTP pyrophosphatase MutT (NUDIX family)
MNTIDCSGAIIFSRITNRMLVLQKNDGKHVNTWGLVGGKNMDNENPWEGLQREIVEEVGVFLNFIKVIPLERFVSYDHHFTFRTYFCIIDNEFIPILSDEHRGYSWAPIFNLPKPIHRGLNLSIRNKIIQSKIQTIIEIIDLL